MSLLRDMKLMSRNKSVDLTGVLSCRATLFECLRHNRLSLRQVFSMWHHNSDLLLVSSISYFLLRKPCIIREQCMLWRHSVCDCLLKRLKRKKLCFVLLYCSLKTQWRHTVFYNWTMHAFLCLTVCWIHSWDWRSIKQAYWCYVIAGAPASHLLNWLNQSF